MAHMGAAKPALIVCTDRRLSHCPFPDPFEGLSQTRLENNIPLGLITLDRIHLVLVSTYICLVFVGKPMVFELWVITKLIQDQLRIWERLGMQPSFKRFVSPQILAVKT